jgi:23S rRNA (guanosine2251-2'-O)-methyltransferase
MPLALVIGSEGKGIGRLILEKCDFLIHLPMRGHVTSLNASVAASLLMYEVYRKRYPQGE